MMYFKWKSAKKTRRTQLKPAFQGLRIHTITIINMIITWKKWTGGVIIILRISIIIGISTNRNMNGLNIDWTRVSQNFDEDMRNDGIEIIISSLDTPIKSDQIYMQTWKYNQRKCLLQRMIRKVCRFIGRWKKRRSWKVMSFWAV